jgi:hypothetical protein
MIVTPPAAEDEATGIRAGCLFCWRPDDSGPGWTGDFEFTPEWPDYFDEATVRRFSEEGSVRL